MLNLFLFGVGVGWLIGMLVAYLMTKKRIDKENEEFVVETLLQREAQLEIWGRKDRS